MLSEAKHPGISLWTNSGILRFAQNDRSGWRARRTRALMMAALCSAILGLLLVPTPLSAQDTRGWQAMGNVPCAWSEPLQAPDHSLDVPRTIRLLRENHFNCYVQPIEEKAPYTYDDFQRLLPAAQAAGIAVWAVLIPHHEGSSPPYGYDFVRWMRELARLSLKYPALGGVNIDDTDVAGEQKLFTHDYFCSIRRAGRAINSRMLFVPTIYDLDPPEADRLAGCVDGAWLVWGNLEKNEGLRAFLVDARIIARGRFPVYAIVYSRWTSWHREGNPKPKILERALTLSCTYADGALIWELPLAPPFNPWLEAARKFTAGGSSELAGKCGDAAAREDAGR
jgi:hypothetical protein